MVFFRIARNAVLTIKNVSHGPSSVCRGGGKEMIGRLRQKLVEFDGMRSGTSIDGKASKKKW